MNSLRKFPVLLMHMYAILYVKYTIFNRECVSIGLTTLTCALVLHHVFLDFLIGCVILEAYLAIDLLFYQQSGTQRFPSGPLNNSGFGTASRRILGDRCCHRFGGHGFLNWFGDRMQRIESQPIFIRGISQVQQVLINVNLGKFIQVLSLPFGRLYLILLFLIVFLPIFRGVRSRY